MLRILLILFLLPLSSYSLPKCEGTNPMKWNNCVGTFTLLDGGEYVGEFKDGTQHGKGTYTSADGGKMWQYCRSVKDTRTCKYLYYHEVFPS